MEGPLQIEDDDQILDKVGGAKYNPDEVTIEDQMSKKADQEQESPDASIYSHESGELFAEDVDQHMVVLPEVDYADHGSVDRRRTGWRSQ